MLVGRNRLWIGLAALALLACFGPGCDSKQPTDASGGNGNAVVEFTATADVTVDDVYDFFVDANHCADNCTSDLDCNQSTLHRCRNNVCVVPCTQTSDCLFGQTCNVPAGTCYPVSSVACAQPDNSCIPGATTCVFDQDGLPDDASGDGVADVFQVCVPVKTGPTTNLTRTANVPLNYWVDIKRVRSGSTAQEQISDPALFNAPIANTGFSTNPIETGVSPARPAFDPTDPTHVYTNARRMDESRAELIALPPLQETDPGVPDIGIAATGRTVYCPFGFTFPAPLTFSMDLQAGDTLLVKARKLSPPSVPFNTEPKLTSQVLLNGVVQVPVGTAEATAPGGDLAFSFTVR